MANQSSKIWALRMPGGPTKVIRSQKLISEDQAKKIYLKSFHYVRTETVNETVWPLLKTLDESTVREYDSFTQLSKVTGRPRALVEV